MTEFGRGDTWVILHGGWAAEHSYLLEAFEGQEKRHRLVFYDQRGSLRSPFQVFKYGGGKPCPENVITVEKHVEDLERLRSELGLEKMNLLAHSMGNFLALSYLERYPNRVKGLVLVAPANLKTPGSEEVGYAVPVVPGSHQMCCYSSDNCCGHCALEASKSDTEHSAGSGQVSLEPPRILLVLFRVEQKNVGKIRTLSQDCELDAGGLPFHWLTDVGPAESVALMATFAAVAESPGESREARKMRESALAAIALHADPAADRALEQFVGAGQTESVRRRAAFWLGAARGRRGFELLRKLVREDASERFREHAVFALSVSKEPEAAQAMIGAARHDSSSRVRGQALFWLAQKAGRQAAEPITQAIENDPETEVKRRAVFALSQLPKEEGVPLLIQVARANKNPAVRKQAMFWLGQSKDPRALTFFEEILTRR